MERFFSGLITTLSVPILILNVLGGIVGGIWLMIAGEWSLFIGGLLYMMFGAMVIGLLLMPSLLFAAPAAAFAEKRKYILFFIFGLLGIAYTYGLIAVSTYYIADIALSSQSAPLWASLLWLYAVVLAPWQYMASKEQDNTSTGMTTFFLALGVIALMVCIGIFGMTLGQAFPVLVVILVISLVIQLLFTYALTRAEKQTTQHNEVIEVGPEDNDKRTWGDLE
jgi:hypothetical protein